MGLLSAQGKEVHTLVGDPAPGGDTVRRFLTYQVDDRGQVLQVLQTNDPDGDRDTLLALEDDVLLQEGQSISPVGTALDDFFQVSWAGRDVATILRVTEPGIPQRRAAYWNGRRFALEDAPLIASGTGPGTNWLDLEAIRSNGKRSVLVAGRADDPSVPGPEAVLVRYRFGEQGTLLAADVLARTSDLLPTLSAPIRFILRLSSSLGLNDRGDTLCVVTDMNLQSSLLLNQTFSLARDGDSSPVAGRRYDRIALTRVALNDLRDYAFTARLDGDPITTNVLIKNGVKFVQQGDVLPGFSKPLGSFLTYPIVLSNSGNLYWGAVDVAPIGSGDVFLRDRDVIVQEGQIIGGRTVTSVIVSSTSPRFAVSPAGRFWIGQVELDGVEALVTADFGLAVRFGGCQANDGDLSQAGGFVLPGQPLQLAMNRGQAAGALPILKVGTRRLAGPCGMMTVAGEALLDPTSVVATLVGPAWTGAASAFSIPVPNTLSLVDQEFFAQGVFLDAAGQSPAPRLRLTNGLRIEIGAP